MKIPNLADYTPEQLNSYVASLPNELMGKVIFELVLILYDSPDRVSEARSICQICRMLRLVGL